MTGHGTPNGHGPHRPANGHGTPGPAHTPGPAQTQGTAHTQGTARTPDLAHTPDLADTHGPTDTHGPAHTQGTAGPFDTLMAQVLARADRFGHRQHLHLTWLAVRQYGTAAAIRLVSDGIARTARYAGAPQKYHVTVSRAWVELVGHHVAGGDTGDFDDFLDRYPALLDKRLLTRHYRSSTLATAEARSGWVAPDLAPLPGWDSPDGPGSATAR